MNTALSEVLKTYYMYVNARFIRKEEQFPAKFMTTLTFCNERRRERRGEKEKKIEGIPPLLLVGGPEADIVFWEEIRG